MRTITTGAAAIAMLGLALTGCTSNEPGGEPTAASEPETSPDGPTTSEPSVVQTSEATEAAPHDGPEDAGAGLTGFGATRQAWDANHEQAPGYTGGAAYLPMAYENQPTYATVCCGDQITLYTFMVPMGTNMTEAQALVAGELPDDAVGGDLVDKGGCTMQVWESDALQDAVGSNALITYFLDDPNPNVILTTGDSADGIDC